MKKVFIVIGSLCAVFVIGLVVLMTVDLNRFNKDAYYVHITADGEREEHPLDTGEIMETYWYELASYNEDGKEQSLKFSANKNLRQDAYLKLYVNNTTEVTSYDEVQFDEIPVKVQALLQ